MAVANPFHSLDVTASLCIHLLQVYSYQTDNPAEDASVAFPSASASDTVKEQGNNFSVEDHSKSRAHKVKLSLILRSPHSSVSMGAPMSQYCGLIPCPKVRFRIRSNSSRELREGRIFLHPKMIFSISMSVKK